ncbi:MAG: isoprenylcysteine carboxylmethyltransferase family protein [Rhizomicrobium sp.]
MNAPANRLGSVIAAFRRGTKTYDLIATTPLVAWYVLCLCVVAPDIVHGLRAASDLGLQIRALLSLLSQISKFAFAFLLIVLLIARRTPLAGAQGWAPRVVAFLGGYLPVTLLILPGRGVESHMLLLSSFLTFFGMVFAVFSLAWLGRSISLFPESRKLVTSGPYSVIRHPLYLGEQTALVGVALQVGTLWAVAAIALQFCCQLYRMNCEEKVLTGSFPEYAAYKTGTYRLIPGLY